MKFPTIHLNGTSSSELLETACDALGVLRAAIEAVNATSPNRRDYYPQGDSAYTDAAREHAGRIAKLWSVLAELEQLAEHIVDAQDARHSNSLPVT